MNIQYNEIDLSSLPKLPSHRFSADDGRICVKFDIWEEGGNVVAFKEKNESYKPIWVAKGHLDQARDWMLQNIPSNLQVGDRLQELDADFLPVFPQESPWGPRAEFKGRVGWYRPVKPYAHLIQGIESGWWKSRVWWQKNRLYKDLGKLIAEKIAFPDWETFATSKFWDYYEIPGAGTPAGTARVQYWENGQVLANGGGKFEVSRSVGRLNGKEGTTVWEREGITPF